MKHEKVDDIIKDREQTRKKIQTLKNNRKEELEKENSIKSKNRNKLSQIMKKRNKKWFWVTYENELSVALLAVIVLISLYFKFFGHRESLADYPINDDNYIKTRNSELRDFKIGYSDYFSDKTMEDADKMANNYLNNKSLDSCEAVTDEEYKNIPKEYNFINNLKNCKEPIYKQLLNESISYIQSPLSLLKEKMCLQYNETFEPDMEYIFACDKSKNKELKGGVTSSVLKFLKDNGVINKGCLKVDQKKCPSLEEIKNCTLKKIQNYCIVKGKEFIKKEILKNGSVLGMLPYYKDFLLYKSGIFYTDIESSKIEGYQVVKIIGWGVNADDIEYWIVENTFGENYGNNGYINLYMHNEDEFFTEVISVIA